MKRTEIIDQIKDIMRRIAPTAQTILFGSEARGDARIDSDIDLLILIDGEKMTLEREEEITLPLYFACSFLYSTISSSVIPASL